MRRWRQGCVTVAVTAAVLGSLAAPAWAEDPAPAPPALAPGAENELDLFALDSQLEQQVVSSTKTEQRGAVTPAVITVINADEIQARGYTSLADILRAVPGFYDVYDLVTHNIGVRGINGGARASGNVIKLMIDGHAVDYRPSTGNFFGEELIPLQVIERVEIIRGPASALYGANAFLGVVNVITKSGEAVNGVKLVGQGALVREHLGGGGGAVMGGSSGPVDVLVGVNYLYLDRGGLGLGGTSPLSGSARSEVNGRGPSGPDVARPKTIFGKLSLTNVAYGKLSLLATVQNLDSNGEFQDLGPLTHGTRISMVNQNYRAVWQLERERFSIRVSGHYFTASPGAKDRLDTGRPDFRLIRSVGVDGFGFAVESRVKAHKLFTLTVGADLVQEDHLLQTFSQKFTQNFFGPGGVLLRKEGTIEPVDRPSERQLFRNLGAFAQGVFAKNDWSAIGGLRIDYHNIYGANFSGRLGVVYAPSARPLSVKLLYGGSFKAPSAEQLYTQAIGQGDIRGNPRLQSQTAHTVELYGGYRLPKERGEISLNVFATDVIGRIEFVPSGLFAEAQNILDEWAVGGELDSRFMLARPLHLRFLAGVARTVARSAGGGLLGQPEVSNPLFPAYQFHLFLDYALPWWGLRLSAEASYIGPRNSSFANALVRGAPYEVPGYFYTAAVVSTAGRKIIPNRETSLALRVMNVINTAWTEPGFGGIDVPTQGITAFLTIVQGL